MKAVIDIGTNTVLLLIGRRAEDGRVDVLHDEARITRLGRGVELSGRLDPASVEQTLQVLEDYRELARHHDAELVAVATEGLRMAADREAFLQRAHAVLGRPLRLVSGDEEAELSFLSVARESPNDAPLRVLDIGGGSTELVVGHGTTIEARRSHPIGSVRLTERLVHHDPPTHDEVRLIEDAAREALSTQPVASHDTLHGLAGTVTTAGALLLGLERYDREAVDGTRAELGDIVALRDTLATETLEQRLRRPMLPSGRADVIVAGLSILKVALEHCGARWLVVRDRGLRFALL